MLTISLIMVINQQGYKKVAQYCRFDGYPYGVGVGVLNFIKNKELFEKFKINLSKVRFLDKKGIDKEFYESFNKNAPKWLNDKDNRTQKEKDWFDNYYNVDLSEKSLVNIANSIDNEIILVDSEYIANHGLAEYSYVINLKKNTFEVYRHIDKKTIKIYKLDELPKEDVFISELKNF